ncbi:hypothetical protein PG985_011332 [Apiospora marii]|uniref:Uncharacterized protein n=1 Tax=Apiospora marii TaxID=335849 RepID=A0ABR1STE5_9PEZI
MWSSSPFNSQRSVFSTAPRHKQSFGPSPLPSFYGAAEGRRNDQVVAQYASARLVNSVFAHARTQHLPAAQRPIRHPGEARSPYHAADRVVAGSGADDTGTPRMMPRAQIQTALTPPHYTPPTALAARAVGMDDAQVQGLQVRNRLRDDERRRRKIRKQREVMAEHTRRLQAQQEKQEALEREKRRRPAALGPGRHPKQASRLYSVLKRRVQHHDDENMYWGASLAPTSSTSAQKKKNLKVTFCPDEILGKDEEGAWVPHRQTDRAEYEERWFPGPGPDDYRRHKERRYARAKVLLQERVRRVQRNGGYENDYGLQQERIRNEIMIGHEDEDDSERESDQGGEEEEEYGGDRRREEEVVLLGMHGVDSEGAR